VKNKNKIIIGLTVGFALVIILLVIITGRAKIPHMPDPEPVPS